MIPFIILIHIIAAAVWTRGHLVLAIGFLPKALKNQDPAIIDFFNSVDSSSAGGVTAIIDDSSVTKNDVCVSGVTDEAARIVYLPIAASLELS